MSLGFRRRDTKWDAFRGDIYEPPSSSSSHDVGDRRLQDSSITRVREDVAGIDIDTSNNSSLQDPEGCRSIRTPRVMFGGDRCGLAME